ncbi:zinc finger BED domain-containing protein RICESLEEPER 2 [Beta vulgaris subsp. vulgaris]|uniref:zinc finger BED domain-containing protein RICESLEEPER 2 n=1 Tax=Beta vulgaris subsp. vulgaris TaxID=3555 RepID=UPI0020373FBE|nr:zinc finger BED domain-containing protein RICESLEEPER 2 [Beta vulgaris subsp. vulgaris]XP_010678443.2 zinc finger BED domain-containing protein RICESLEEPER 2 [Beta vulgaris subsp. vulgaris]
MQLKVPSAMDGNMIAVIDGKNALVESDINRNKKRSPAWDHFEKLPTLSKNEGKAKCIHCDSVFSATPRSGTSHLKRHMERCVKRTALDIQPISMDFGFNDFEGSGPSIKLGKRVSKVWHEYELFPAPNMNDAKAKCKHCKLVLSAASKNGTSHLKRHLDKCSKRVTLTGNIDQYFLCNEKLVEGNDFNKLPKDGSATSSLKPLSTIGGNLAEGSKLMENGQVDQDELQRYISICIIKGAHPFSFVEERGFRSMMSKAYPQFKPFSRAIVRKELFSMYLKERDNIKEILAKAPGRICLTVGNWRARDTKDEYICVTTQFIDEHWRLLRRVLCFKSLAPPYDGTYIADELACLSSQYNIECKTFTITVDEASYDKSTVSSIKRGLLTKKASVSGGSFFQVNCYAHILNFLAQSSLKLVDDIVDRIRELVKYVNKSPLQRKKFFDLAERTFELQARKRLSLDVMLRWNSTYKLIDRTIYYKSVFKHLLESKQELSSLALSKEEWQKLSIIHKFLRVLYDVTHLLSATNGPTANLFLKGMLMVHCRMMEIAKGPNLFLAHAVQAMQVKFNDFWCENNLILSCAAILDPRYKVKFVEYCYMKLFGPANFEDRVSKVVNTLYCLFAEYKRQSLHFSSPAVGSSSVNTNFVGGDDEGDMFGDYDQFLSSTSRSQGNKSELDLYLEELSYDLNSELDVLEFWSRSSMRYPTLSFMARDILSIPVFTVNSKEAFSFGNKTLSSVQSSIMPETLQALLCLQDWLGAEDNSDDQTVTAEDPSGSSEDAEYDNDDDDSVLTDSF